MLERERKWPLVNRTVVEDLGHLGRDKSVATYINNLNVDTTVTIFPKIQFKIF